MMNQPNQRLITSEHVECSFLGRCAVTERFSFYFNTENEQVALLYTSQTAIEISRLYRLCVDGEQ